MPKLALKRRDALAIPRVLAFLLLLAPPAGLSAPAAAQGHYKPANAIGEGYREHEIRPGVWKVSGNYSAGSGGRYTAIAAANYRAAALMKQNGFQYMRVMRIGGFTLDMNSGNGWSGGSGPGYAWLIVRGAASAQDDQGCEMRDTSQCRTLAVDEVMAYWRRALRLTR